jgi:PadR family transcriptional regulator PadR
MAAARTAALQIRDGGTAISDYAEGVSNSSGPKEAPHFCGAGECVAKGKREALLFFFPFSYGKCRSSLSRIPPASASSDHPLSKKFDIHCAAMYQAGMLSKELVAASTEPLILSILTGGESYGYALIQKVKELSKEQIEWTDGMLYPVLHRMETRGFIEARWGESDQGRKRKYYFLKEEGRAAMNQHYDQWSLVHSIINGLRKGESHV